MISRRRVLQGMAAATVLGMFRPSWATKTAGHFLKPGQKLKPGEYVWEPELSPEGPVAVLVSLPEQMAHVYRNGLEIGVTTVSTGRKGHRTPTGVFVILQKDRHHHSSIYHNASMPIPQLTCAPRMAPPLIASNSTRCLSSSLWEHCIPACR